jgi:hypothetical protein
LGWSEKLDRGVISGDFPRLSFYILSGYGCGRAGEAAGRFLQRVIMSRRNTKSNKKVNDGDAGVPREDDAAERQARWQATQDRLRWQAEQIKHAETLEGRLEVMLTCEVEEGTHEDDAEMSAAALDRRKQRIKDWLGNLVRMQSAKEQRDLAKAKFDLVKQKSDGGAVLVHPDVVVDHRALMNWLEKRPELQPSFEEERDALDKG